MVVGITLVVRRSGGTKATATATPAPIARATTVAPAPATAPKPTHEARIAVAVATLWIEPGMARAVDAPSLANPVDIGRWVSAMSIAEKQWLVGKLATQALYGDRVFLLDTRGAWSKVAVADQPSSQDRNGYPGWLPTAQLTFRTSQDTDRRALVTRTTAALRDITAPGRILMALSYNTRLPVLAVTPTWTTVATPDGASALVASSDVAILVPAAPPPTGQELVRTAQAFSGLAYLWAGTSGWGFDCSGFTSTVYAAHGITLPRDADEQATTGTPVAPSQLQPGDLLFYAGAGGQGHIHHVAMYAGAGLMIQSPATGRAVETVPVNVHGEFWGARRYLRAASGP